jgi:hypothetical protein
MNKYLVIGFLGLLLVGSIVVYNDYAIPQLIPEDYNCQEHQGFEGPVRPTDDLDYFRKTGMTRPLEDKE